jgi:hypothetical protein
MIKSSKPFDTSLFTWKNVTQFFLHNCITLK